jgi:hypothetical protein
LPNENRRPRVGDVIRVFYRIGGGVDGNITTNSINTSKNLTVTPISPYPPAPINVTATFSNPSEGVNGKDTETIEHATIYGPMRVKTAEKLVTEQDYDILLSADSTVVKSKAYGNNNMPADLYSLYYEFIKPLDVWNFILKDKPGWRSLTPSQYNVFRWITMRLENRFNELHTLKDGEFNYNDVIAITSLLYSTVVDWSGAGDITFKNCFYLKTPQEFKDGLKSGALPNPNFLAKICTALVDTNFFSELSDYNLFNESYSTNAGLLEGDTPTWRIYCPRNANHLSNRNITGNVGVVTKNLLKMSFDNREPIETDFRTDFLYGYQEFLTRTDPAVTAVYTFKVSVDGAVAGADLSVSLNAGDGLSGIATKIDTALTGAGKTAGCALNAATDRIRITSDSTGPTSIISILAPDTGTSLLTLLGGVDVSFNGLPADEDAVTPAEFQEMINRVYRQSEYYNYGISGVNGAQEFGLAISPDDLITAMEDDPDQTYYFYLNGVERSILMNSNVTGDIDPTDLTGKTVINVTTPGDMESLQVGMYISGASVLTAGTYVTELDTGNHKFKVSSALDTTPPLTGKTFYLNRTYRSIVNKMEEALKFTIVGDLENNSTAITNVNYIGDIDKVKVGMKVSGDGIQIGTVITKINPLEKVIYINKYATENSNNATLTISEFEVALSGGTDIKITNLVARPYSPIYIEIGVTGGATRNLLGTNGLNAPLDTPTVCTYAVGYHDFGILDTDPLSTLGTFNVKINGYTYSIGMDGGDTYLELVTNLNAVPYFNKNYIASAVGGNDVRVTSLGGEQVVIERGDTNDLIAEIETNLTHSILGIDPVGGGDYNFVAEVNENGLADYLRLVSPSMGEGPSRIQWFTTTGFPTNDICFNLFNVTPSVNSIVYGYYRATIIVNEDLTNENTGYGNILLEYGNLSFELSGNKTFYIDYLTSSSDSIYIGDYYFNNFEENVDPEWREKADRVYNTTYDSVTGEVDVENSDFQLRFTAEPTELKSIYAIQNTWDVTESQPAQINSVENVGAYLGSSSYNLVLDIDDQGPIEFDVTGNGGIDPVYDLQWLVDKINTALNGAYTGIYSTYSFASVDYINDVINIRSPIKTDLSKVVVGIPSGNDATQAFFQLKKGIVHTFNVTGDYYMEYDSGANLMKLNRITASQIPSNLPDLPFYIHLIADRRYVEGVYDGESGRDGYSLGTLDEDIYLESMIDKKVTAVNNVFKETKISTFDITGTVYYKKVYSATDVEDRVLTALQTEFQLSNRNFGEPVAKSKVMSVIHSVDGVDYVEITYLGHNAIIPLSNVTNSIQCEFDELIVISEDIYEQGQQTHGINFVYKISEF